MRYLTPEITRFFAEESKMAFIAGPRQVGKTTLAKHLLAKVGMEELYFNWDIESHRRLIVKNPEGFWKNSQFPPLSRNRVSAWTDSQISSMEAISERTLDAVGKDIEILVTGSGRLDIYQRGGDSLLGRYHLYHLHPFTLGEMLQEDRNTVLTPEAFWEALRNGEAPAGALEGLRDLETLPVP